MAWFWEERKNVCKNRAGDISITSAGKCPWCVCSRNIQMFPAWFCMIISTKYMIYFCNLFYRAISHVNVGPSSTSRDALTVPSKREVVTRILHYWLLLRMSHSLPTCALLSWISVLRLDYWVLWASHFVHLTKYNANCFLPWFPQGLVCVDKTFLKSWEGAIVLAKKISIIAAILLGETWVKTVKVEAQERMLGRSVFLFFFFCFCNEGCFLCWLAPRVSSPEKCLAKEYEISF